MSLIARAVLAAFLLSLPGTAELRAQVRAVPGRAGLAPALGLPALGAPSVSAPAPALSPAALAPSPLAAPALAPAALAPVAPAAAKATLVVAAKALAALAPQTGGAASKELAGAAFEGGSERRAAPEVSGEGAPPRPPSWQPPSPKALFLSALRETAPPGKIVAYSTIGKIANKLGMSPDLAGELFNELLKDGHIAIRDNRDAVYYSFRTRSAEADLLAGDAVALTNGADSADHARAVGKADLAVAAYERDGAPAPQLEEARALRANAMLEFFTGLLSSHKNDLESRPGLGPKLRQRAADAAEALAWMKTATYQAGYVPPMPSGVHEKLVRLIGSLNPREADGAPASEEVADGYIAALDLLEKYDKRDFLFEGAPSANSPAGESQAAAFLVELRARTGPGETVTRETLTIAGKALGLDAAGIGAAVSALAAKGQVMALANGAVVYFDLREQAAEDEDGLWDLHNAAVDAIALANAPANAERLRAVARLDAAYTEYFSMSRRSRAIEQVSIALANAKLQAIAGALAPLAGDAAADAALAFLASAWYSAERRQDIDAAAAAALHSAATLRILLGGTFEKEAAKGAKLTRAFIENMKGGSLRTPAPAKSWRDLGMPEAVREAAEAEQRKLEQLDPKDSEAQKIKTYLDWLRAVPWSARTEDTADIAAARAILDRDHAGLELVKERVLEFLAVRKRTGSKKGAIIAFTGPPGTGKTSIASAIAQALGRKFVRLSLGGVHDESVLRGHGRTYVGSMPGEIMRQMKNAGVINPVMLLDEADKIGRNGSQGDPTAALLEILDPEQNNTFRDRYLDVPYDLSEVLFVVTSNELSSIPAPLRDRMEIIEFDGYTTLEKLAIAEKHVVPQKRELVGLKPEEASLTKGALRAIIEGYTMEAGVRGLREKIEILLRKISAWTETRGEEAPAVVDESMVGKYLGVERFSPRQIAQNGVGVATGLAVDAYGGSTLNVEVSKEPGTGQLKLRKQFGDDIEDSARNALKFVKVHAAKYGLQDLDFTKIDIDINITPAGKVDGPSAGGLMVTAILSALTGRPVAPGVAMTGEITMRGDILPIGGLKQKVMAAHRMGYKEVIFPHANLKDLESIPQEVRDGIKLTPARTYDDIYPNALAP